MNRISYLDGLKGCSALIVFLSHFTGAFTCISWIAKVPFLNIFFDGTMAVHIFIILSGFGICSSLTKSDDISKSTSKIIIKRYFRLALPIVIPTLIAYILYVTGMYYNQEVAMATDNQWLSTLMPENIGFINFVSSLLFSPFRSALITPLWMMHYIFLGTFLIIPTTVCIKSIKQKRNKYLFLLFLILIFEKYDCFYASMLLGIAIHCVLQDVKIKSGGVILFPILGLIGSALINSNIIHIIRAVFILSIIITCKPIQSFFSLTPFQRLNDISYSLYLIHAPIICSFSCWIFLKLGENYIIGIFVCTTIICISFSYCLSKIDSITLKWLNKTCNNIIS